jgi:hypothetical protein
LLRNPIRGGGQGPYWAAEPYDDDYYTFPEFNILDYIN